MICLYFKLIKNLTFLKIREEHATRTAIPICNNSDCVTWCNTIEVNIHNTKQNAHVYACTEPVLFESSRLKNSNNPPINNG